jgi:hypothetical protein
MPQGGETLRFIYHRAILESKYQTNEYFALQLETKRAAFGAALGHRAETGGKMI